MAEDEVEAPAGERQRFGVGAGRLDVQPEALALSASAATIPGEMSVQVASPTIPARSRLRLK